MFRGSDDETESIVSRLGKHLIFLHEYSYIVTVISQTETSAGDEHVSHVALRHVCACEKPKLRMIGDN